MRHPLKTICLLILFCLLPLTAKAEQEKWIFLPYAPLFQPLIGDPREQISSVIAYTNESRFEGAVGATAEFLRYLPPDQTQWACGIFGSGFILLDRNRSVYPMEAADWYAGLYASESLGAFSSRFELQHRSAHLGDAYQGILNPIPFTGENFNFTESFRPWEDVRVAAQTGYWFSRLPVEKRFFGSLEAEVYSPAVDMAGTYLRAYSTADFIWKDEAGGVLDQSYQLGIQWKFKKEEARDLRFAFVYYNGNSLYGQFYQSRDEHTGIGVFFDP